MNNYLCKYIRTAFVLWPTLNKITIQKQNKTCHLSTFRRFTDTSVVLLYENIVDQELGKVDFSESSRRTNKRDKSVCLVVTYHSLFENIGSTFHRRLDSLYTDPEVERVFTPDSMALFRSARKISSYLIRVKLHTLERHVDSFKCRGRRCKVFFKCNRNKNIY